MREIDLPTCGDYSGFMRSYGEPPNSVVLLHGGPGAPGTMAPVARELSPERGVLEPMQTAATVDGQLSELKAAIDRHGNPPVTLVGSSWGAMLGFLLASRFPKFVRKLILIGSGVFEEQYAQMITETRFDRLHKGDRIEAERLLAALEDEGITDKDRIFAALGVLVTKADTVDPLTLDTEVLEVQYGLHCAVWKEVVAMRKSRKLLELGRRISCPVVAIHGDHDPHPAEGVRKPLESVLADFRFIPLSNCGHYPWIERQARDEFFEILRSELGPGRHSTVEPVSDIRLEPFDRRWAETVLGWINSPQELRYWTARTDFPLTDASVFDDWHSDPEIAPYILMTENRSVAYGEIWIESDEGSAELARLLVAPTRRRQGLGLKLIERLVSVAHEEGYRQICVRVFPGNAAAIGCYESAGFARVSEQQEAAFNAAQRFPFIWMVRGKESSEQFEGE